MGLIVVLVVLGLPIAEIAGFVVIGGRIGVLATLAWVFLAAIAGIAVIRLQGLATALKLRAALARDELPARTLFDGALVAVAGFLLLLPGFVSDAVAILLLLPPVRGLLFHLAAARISAPVRVNLHRGGPPPPGSGTIIEGEYSEVEPRKDGDSADAARPGPEAGDRRLPGRDARPPER